MIFLKKEISKIKNAIQTFVNIVLNVKLDVFSSEIYIDFGVGQRKM